MHARKLKRILDEVQAVNDDYFSLRTVIAPDPGGDVRHYNFIIVPNDGPMAHMPLVGAMYFRSKYPDSPPVVHLYTETHRYNVDVYRRNLLDRKLSSLCFDILRSELDGGVWRSDFTLSSFFAALMSALVSYYVLQASGHYQKEFVSMSRLRTIKRNSRETYERCKLRCPDLPPTPLVEATMAPAEELFPPQIIRLAGKSLLSSKPIRLQTRGDELYTFAVDLSGLRDETVFSVILSNSKTDLVGKEQSTVLVRNGVTATAARKRAGGETQWFYHGHPMNDGDMRLHVTVGRNQMTFAYHSNGRVYVHGDGPVSRLTSNEIGSVGSQEFYLQIYTEHKTDAAASIEVLDTKGKGYIYEWIDEEDRQTAEFDVVQHEDGEPVNADITEERTAGVNEAEKVSGLLAKLGLSR